MKKGNILLVIFLAMSLGINMISFVDAASVTPGSTTVYMSMPCDQRVTGLTASTAYDVVCITGTNYTCVDGAYSDSNGVLVITITYYQQFGQNTYTVEPDAGGTALATFNINNQDIMPWVSIMLTFIVIGVVIGMIQGIIPTPRRRY